MTTLSLDEVRAIGRDAALDIAHGEVEVIDVFAGADWTDDPAYYMSFSAPADQGDGGIDLFLKILHRVRDALLGRGDDTYPYVSLVGPLSRSRALNG